MTMHKATSQAMPTADITINKSRNPSKAKIYCLEFDDGEYYVGYTTQPLKKRLSNHRLLFETKNLKISLLEEIDISEDPRGNLKYWESFWIAQFKTWGLALKNKNNGGGGPLTHETSEETRLKISKTLKGRESNFKNKKHSEETKEIMSISKKGIIFSDEHIENLSKSKIGKTHSDKTKENMGISKKGENNYFYGTGPMKGKNHTEETKNKISEANKGKKSSRYGKPAHNRKVILQLDIDGNLIREWESIQLITEELNLSRTSIIYTCKGKQKSAGGFHWSYENNENNEINNIK